MSIRKFPYVAVIGGYECSGVDAKRAEEVGKLLAQRGAILVTGGRLGISEAASKGAKQAGGTTIGILPSADFREANAYIDHAICTGIGEARNTCVVMTADGVIAFPGKYGTLSEMAFALLNKKPVVSLGSWEVSDEVVKVDNPQEAVTRILQEIQR
ncbi:MAG: TIGR00725 family protein [Candidatus Zixiibacteriota bacterium]